MATEERRRLIGEIERARNNRMLLVYVTSTRIGAEVPMADDVIRVMFDHLERNRERVTNGIDLFLHSNGGAGTTPWLLVSLLREYAEKLTVIVPHKAFSAATLTALGADEILMHRMGCLGPIDPSVANAFNPPSPGGDGVLPISVEDVTAYLKLVRDEVEINHEDELIQAFNALTAKVHPLALGNVQRHHHQSRMMARKLLKKHMDPVKSEHEISQIIDNLKSNLFYHGHPINRREAKSDLALKVTDLDPALEGLVWDLYREYEAEMRLNEPFMATHELDSRPPPAPAPAPPTTAELVQQLVQMSQAGLNLSVVSEAQLVNMAAAMLPHVQGRSAAPGPLRTQLLGGFVETIDLTHVFRTDLTLERTIIATPNGPQEGIRQGVVWQRWELLT